MLSTKVNQFLLPRVAWFLFMSLTLLFLEAFWWPSHNGHLFLKFSKIGYFCLQLKNHNSVRSYMLIFSHVLWEVDFFNKCVAAVTENRSQSLDLQQTKGRRHRSLMWTRDVVYITFRRSALPQSALSYLWSQNSISSFSIVPQANWLMSRHISQSKP